MKVGYPGQTGAAELFDAYKLRHNRFENFLVITELARLEARLNDLWSDGLERDERAFAEYTRLTSLREDVYGSAEDISSLWRVLANMGGPLVLPTLTTDLAAWVQASIGVG